MKGTEERILYGAGMEGMLRGREAISWYKEMAIFPDGEGVVGRMTPAYYGMISLF